VQLVDASIVRAFAARQRRLNAIAREWLKLPQVQNSTAPLGTAGTLITASEHNVTKLLESIR
jgi:hypothetical protein